MTDKTLDRRRRVDDMVRHLLHVHPFLRWDESTRL